MRRVLIATGSAAATLDKGSILERYARVRARTEELCATLTPEDCTVQSMPEASPTRWHLAHTTWFFATFLLKGRTPEADADPPEYEHLFNSYYNSVGRPFPRPRRGVVSRPGLAEILAYRKKIDEAVHRWFREVDGATWVETGPIVELGLHHEQQHQELIVTDIKHAFYQNPLRPVFRARDASRAETAQPGGRSPAVTSERDAGGRWMDLEGGIVEVGHAGDGFAFDNESPRHRTLLQPFALARSPVTCGEYLEFVRDGGYEDPRLWLSDGWDRRRAEGWCAPLYWDADGPGEEIQVFTCSGMRPLEPSEPVCHVSYYEADAYARWAGHRLPTEQEWEAAAVREARIEGNFADGGRFHPAPVASPGIFGDAWEWTASAYLPYPGFRPAAGALGEYNGKFMSGQMVLRGGSCATPADHIRATYRNFFPPEARWQFAGLRLARDL